MALTHRWTGRSEADVIGRVRMHCYAAQAADLPKFVGSVTDDDRVRDGDFLLVERDGRAVGTATSLHLNMHVRGAAVPCHGVAYVGAIRTERRKGTKAEGELGVASYVMKETVKRGRESGAVVSALMPFRASYYEHFGYGVVERHAAWVLPMGVLPSGDTGNFVPYEAEHLPGLVKSRNEIARGGQCDIERPEQIWRAMLKNLLEGPSGGFLFVDPGRAWVTVYTEYENGIAAARVRDWGGAGPGDLVRVLRLLGSLRDQYSKAYISTPADWPVNRLLKESQVPHRPVAHPVADVRVFTRMQVRVLDHVRLVEGMRWPVGVRGESVVSVREVEGWESRFRVGVEGGRAVAKATEATPTIVMADKTWAAVATGELPASAAVRFGLAEGEAGVLEGLGWGAKPFTYEYF